MSSSLGNQPIAPSWTNDAPDLEAPPDASRWSPPLAASSPSVFPTRFVHAAACPVVAAPHDDSRNSDVRWLQVAAPPSPCSSPHGINFDAVRSKKAETFQQKTRFQQNIIWFQQKHCVVPAKNEMVFSKTLICLSQKNYMVPAKSDYGSSKKTQMQQKSSWSQIFGWVGGSKNMV